MGIALAAVVCGCQNMGQKKSSEPAAAMPEVVPVVNVTKTVRETVPQDAVYSANVQAYAVNNIAPQSGNRIQKINVEVGDFVSAGQVLAEMDRFQLDQSALQLKNSETELNRLRQLLQEGGVSQSDFESLELSYNVAKASYDNLEQNTILRSPISGVVTARNYDRGDMYTMSQPLFTVQQITPVKILVGISESDYTKVKKGDKVSLTVDALPGSTFTGTVARLYPTMDAATHTFSVEVQVRNENRQLRPGMYARVTVNFGNNDSIVIPDAAVVKMQGSGVRSVYVVNGDNTVSLRTVTVGRHLEGRYEVLEGLEENETIVVKGQSALKSGIKVEVE